jgi:hypothetical protein
MQQQTTDPLSKPSPHAADPWLPCLAVRPSAVMPITSSRFLKDPAASSLVLEGAAPDGGVSPANGTAVPYDPWAAALDYTLTDAWLVDPTTGGRQPLWLYDATGWASFSAASCRPLYVATAATASPAMAPGGACAAFPPFGSPLAPAGGSPVWDRRLMDGGMVRGDGEQTRVTRVHSALTCTPVPQADRAAARAHDSSSLARHARPHTLRSLDAGAPPFVAIGLHLLNCFAAGGTALPTLVYTHTLELRGDEGEPALWVRGLSATRRCGRAELLLSACESHDRMCPQQGSSKAPSPQGR